MVHPLHRARGTAAAVGTALVLAALSLAAFGLAYAADDASAYCINWGGETSTPAGAMRLRNRDVQRRRRLRRHGRGPGRGLQLRWVEFQDGGTMYTVGEACTSTPVGFSFTDKTGDSSASIRLCRLQGCTGWTSTYGY